MNHIRFVSTNTTVCENPKRLGLDFVVADSSSIDTDRCRVCSQLLMMHNARQYDNNPPFVDEYRDPRPEVYTSAMTASDVFWSFLLGAASASFLFLFVMLVF